ncbi:endonuclease NucS domain-containing protein [Caldanaerobacter sp.]|uniref:endonuclease NucS domain-containing protein n=1 Tax=Caldanaerobacter sp. TaxID=2930036 RepID=UPI003C772D68
MISVSNKTNLNLCLKYALAGFTNSVNGLWTFMEIQEGDFVSFLHGARVFNLYKVEKKEAIKNAEALPPWPPVTFKTSRKTYYFPFRLYLKPLRQFVESMVRPEFAYVAENLLLRGGYRKTHFQADQTTLQSVSQMGEVYNKPIEALLISNYKTFVPYIVWDRELESSPETFYFQEFILQSLIRQHLSVSTNLQIFLNSAGLDTFHAEDFEVLGEKALSEGYVDILIKDRTPVGYSRKIVLEIKTGSAKSKDIEQLENYTKEIGEECVAGVLIAQKFSRNLKQECEKRGIKPFVYTFGQIERSRKYTLEDLKQKLQLLKI